MSLHGFATRFAFSKKQKKKNNKKKCTVELKEMQEKCITIAYKKGVNSITIDQGSNHSQRLFCNIFDHFSSVQQWSDALQQSSAANSTIMLTSMFYNEKMKNQLMGNLLSKYLHETIFNLGNSSWKQSDVANHNE